MTQTPMFCCKQWSRLSPLPIHNHPCEFDCLSLSMPCYSNSNSLLLCYSKQCQETHPPPWNTTRCWRWCTTSRTRRRQEIWWRASTWARPTTRGRRRSPVHSGTCSMTSPSCPLRRWVCPSICCTCCLRGAQWSWPFIDYINLLKKKSST